MIWSRKGKCWCVLAGEGQSLLDAAAWCRLRFGESNITGLREGLWYWGVGGDMFGINFCTGRPGPDPRTYFGFFDQKDALMFRLACG